MTVEVKQRQCQRNECVDPCKTIVKEQYTELWYVDRTKTGRNVVYSEFFGRGGCVRSEKDVWCYKGVDPPSLNRATCGYVGYAGAAFFVPRADSSIRWQSIRIWTDWLSKRASCWFTSKGEI